MDYKIVLSDKSGNVVSKRHSYLLDNKELSA